MANPTCYIGLMSGTSLDGVDGVLVEIHDAPGAADAARPRVLQHASRPFLDVLRQELLALNTAGEDELHRAALAGTALSQVYAEVVEALLAASSLPRTAVRAIGAHGQTVRHRPLAFDGVGYTLQLQNPSLLAERCGIDVVADFRSRDVAAGGQGAPLVPAFHAAWFGRPDAAVAVLNIGGIANLSLLPPSGDPAGGPVGGYDCGPGNALLDHWCRLHTGAPYDADGAWAATGRVLPALREALWTGEPFFALPPPKSTGRDLFHPAWLAQRLAACPDAAPADVQATLTELTVRAAAAGVSSYRNGSVEELVVCGGGALNGQLMRGLAAALPGVVVRTSDAHGLPPLQVEATAFAWLAQRFMVRAPGNLPAVTGARGLRVLGALYPA
ncbi:anhydro-N-acetylmuramic acid kinase [uncultured Xylophilus sp.]|uniref:anhydro-N-acetylmuramic acid kinase n=1 Tax=uncultured Xylophilus sp. TaxID=296832 RepID=UPI0025FC815D|nr:anhydro-N-acetylmuramic acid kinase [uncultured Xylophilus sp.]